MQNVDQQEVEKFSALAKHWWQTDGDLKTLHQLNPLRLQFIQTHSPLLNKTVLDVGCGGGILTESMARCDADATGIDMSASVIACAKAHALQSGLAINYLQIPVADFAQQHAQQFDVITCMELLEHVPQPLALIQACQQLAKPGAKLFFSTINRSPSAFLQTIIGAEYLLQLLPKGTHNYDKFIRPSELAHWLRQSQLTLETMTGIKYNPVSQQFSLTQNVQTNYMVCCSNSIN
jgi:2-polyprenyl-6-hydroxyphenyl methylase / 3-demethylubiquinone-9 3-methyltransferase